jgi:hypothetical protein
MLPFLFLLPIVVVDVSGEHLDPAHTRKLVEHELGVTASAPDDSRVGEATGHIEIASDANGKKLTVKYRKVDEPIERTIDLADDGARAESDAAFLAGNLARDEASELAPRAKPREPLYSEDDRQLGQLHAFLKQTSADEDSARTRNAVVGLTAGAALVGTAATIAFTDRKSAEVRAGAHGAGLAGGWLIGYGLAGLFIRPKPLEPLEKRLKELEASGASSAEILATMDEEWAKTASDVKRGRVIVGSIFMGLGAIAAGTGTALTIANADDATPPSTGLTLVGAGLFAVVTGIASIVSESPVERSYRMWKTVQTKPDPLSNISVGMAVLPGGGGAASFALTF